MAGNQIELSRLAIDVEHGPFSEWLEEMRGKAEAYVRDNPPTPEIKGPDDYRYAKQNLAALRKIAKEARDGRSRITKELDAAKKYVMGETSKRIKAVEDAIEAEDAVLKGYEQRAREAKRERLRAYWEETYPALALCVAGDPLLPFDGVFDPAWVKLMSKVGDDKEAREAMDGVADSIAAGQQVLAELDVDADLRDAAVSELCRTRDLGSAIKRAKDEQARRETARMIREQQEQEARQSAESAANHAVEHEQEPVETEAVDEPGNEATAPQTAQEIAPGVTVLHVPVYVVTIECRGDADLQRVVDVMRSAGIHGEWKRVA